MAFDRLHYNVKILQRTNSLPAYLKIIFSTD